MFAPWFWKKYIAPVELWDATTGFDWRLVVIVGGIYLPLVIGTILGSGFVFIGLGITGVIWFTFWRFLR